jgi:hypothetical protein
MTKDIRVKVVMAVFPFFFCSCVTTGVKTKSVEGLPPENFREPDILAVQMRSGEVYRFSETQPAAVIEEHIKGESMERREIPLNQVKRLVKDPMGNVQKVVQTNGETHKLALGQIEKDTLIAYLDEPPFRAVSLLYSQASLITYKARKFDVAGTSLLIVGIVAAVALAGVLGIAAWFKTIFGGH